MRNPFSSSINPFQPRGSSSIASGRSARKMQSDAPVRFDQYDTDKSEERIMDYDLWLQELIQERLKSRGNQRQDLLDFLEYYDHTIAQLTEQVNREHSDDKTKQYQSYLDHIDAQLKLPLEERSHDVPWQGAPMRPQNYALKSRQKYWENAMRLRRENLRDQSEEAKLLAGYKRKRGQTQEAYDKLFDEYGMRKSVSLGAAFGRGITDPRALADSFVAGLGDAVIGLPVLALQSPTLLKEIALFQEQFGIGVEVGDIRSVGTPFGQLSIPTGTRLRRTGDMAEREDQEVGKVVAKYGENSLEHEQVLINQLNTRLAWARENTPTLLPLLQYYYESFSSAWLDPETFAQTLEERPFDVYVHALDAAGMLGQTGASGIARTRIKQGLRGEGTSPQTLGRLQKGLSAMGKFADYVNPEQLPFEIGGRAYEGFRDWYERKYVDNRWQRPGTFDQSEFGQKVESTVRGQDSEVLRPHLTPEAQSLFNISDPPETSPRANPMRRTEPENPYTDPGFPDIADIPRDIADVQIDEGVSYGQFISNLTRSLNPELPPPAPEWEEPPMSHGGDPEDGDQLGEGEEITRQMGEEITRQTMERNRDQAQTRLLEELDRVIRGINSGEINIPYPEYITNISDNREINNIKDAISKWHLNMFQIVTTELNKAISDDPDDDSPPFPTTPSRHGLPSGFIRFPEGLQHLFGLMNRYITHENFLHEFIIAESRGGRERGAASEGGSTYRPSRSMNEVRRIVQGDQERLRREGEIRVPIQQTHPDNPFFVTADTELHLTGAHGVTRRTLNSVIDTYDLSNRFERMSGSRFNTDTERFTDHRRGRPVLMSMQELIDLVNQRETELAEADMANNNFDAIEARQTIFENLMNEWNQEPDTPRSAPEGFNRESQLDEGLSDVHLSTINEAVQFLNANAFGDPSWTDTSLWNINFIDQLVNRFIEYFNEEADHATRELASSDLATSEISSTRYDEAIELYDNLVELLDVLQRQLPDSITPEFTQPATRPVTQPATQTTTPGQTTPEVVRTTVQGRAAQNLIDVYESWIEMVESGDESSGIEGIQAQEEEHNTRMHLNEYVYDYARDRFQYIVGRPPTNVEMESENPFMETVMNRVDSLIDYQNLPTEFLRLVVELNEIVMDALDEAEITERSSERSSTPDADPNVDADGINRTSEVDESTTFQAVLDRMHSWESDLDEIQDRIDQFGDDEVIYDSEAQHEYENVIQPLEEEIQELEDRIEDSESLQNSREEQLSDLDPDSDTAEALQAEYDDTQAAIEELREELEELESERDSHQYIIDHGELDIEHAIEQRQEVQDELEDMVNTIGDRVQELFTNYGEQFGYDYDVDGLYDNVIDLLRESYIDQSSYSDLTDIDIVDYIERPYYRDSEPSPPDSLWGHITETDQSNIMHALEAVGWLADLEVSRMRNQDVNLNALRRIGEVIDHHISLETPEARYENIIRNYLRTEFQLELLPLVHFQDIGEQLAAFFETTNVPERDRTHVINRFVGGRESLQHIHYMDQLETIRENIEPMITRFEAEGVPTPDIEGTTGSLNVGGMAWSNPQAYIIDRVGEDYAENSNTIHTIETWEQASEYLDDENLYNASNAIDRTLEEMEGSPPTIAESELTQQQRNYAGELVVGNVTRENATAYVDYWLPELIAAEAHRSNLIERFGEDGTFTWGGVIDLFRSLSTNANMRVRADRIVEVVVEALNVESLNDESLSSPTQTEPAERGDSVLAELEIIADHLGTDLTRHLREYADLTPDDFHISRIENFWDLMDRMYQSVNAGPETRDRLNSRIMQIIRDREPFWSNLTENEVGQIRDAQNALENSGLDSSLELPNMPGDWDLDTLREIEEELSLALVRVEEGELELNPFVLDLGGLEIIWGGISNLIQELEDRGVGDGVTTSILEEQLEGRYDTPDTSSEANTLPPNTHTLVGYGGALQFGDGASPTAPEMAAEMNLPDNMQTWQEIIDYLINDTDSESGHRFANMAAGRLLEMFPRPEVAEGDGEYLTRVIEVLDTIEQNDSVREHRNRFGLIQSNMVEPTNFDVLNAQRILGNFLPDDDPQRSSLRLLIDQRLLRMYESVRNFEELENWEFLSLSELQSILNEAGRSDEADIIQSIRSERSTVTNRANQETAHRERLQRLRDVINEYQSANGSFSIADNFEDQVLEDLVYSLSSVIEELFPEHADAQLEDVLFDIEILQDLWEGADGYYYSNSFGRTVPVPDDESLSIEQRLRSMAYNFTQRFPAGEVPRLDDDDWEEPPGSYGGDPADGDQLGDTTNERSNANTGTGQASASAGDTRADTEETQGVRPWETELANQEELGDTEFKELAKKAIAKDIVEQFNAGELDTSDPDLRVISDYLNTNPRSHTPTRAFLDLLDRKSFYEGQIPAYTALSKLLGEVMQRRFDRASASTYTEEVTRSQLSEWDNAEDIFFRIDTRGRRETTGWMGERSYIDHTFDQLVIGEVNDFLADQDRLDEFLEEQGYSENDMPDPERLKVMLYDYIIEDDFWLEQRTHEILEDEGITWSEELDSYRSDGIYVVRDIADLARYVLPSFHGKDASDIIDATRNFDQVVQVVRGKNPRTPAQFEGSDYKTEQLVSDPEIVSEFPAEMLLDVEVPEDEELRRNIMGHWHMGDVKFGELQRFSDLLNRVIHRFIDDTDGEPDAGDRTQSKNPFQIQNRQVSQRANPFA